MGGMAAIIERQNVAVHPTGAAVGADIAGVDLAGGLGPETVAAIKEAWAAHLVLRFRGQRLSDDDLLRFSRQFGELDWAPIAAARVKVLGEERYVDAAPEGHQYLMVISNVIENGQAIGQLGAYEAIWHTDMSYIAEPPSASALYSLEVPAATTRAATAPANCAAALSMPRIRAGRSAPSTRSCAPIRSPGGRRYFSAAAATPTSRGCPSPTAKHCSMRCGRTRPGRSSPGTRHGGSAI
jgi:alpha-ketoglutarate-dependent taurine dioxygenase